MNVRPLIAALAFVSVAAPIAAHADAPSGDINTVFAIDQAVKVERAQFDRSQARLYIEGELPSTARADSVSREQVLGELAEMPQEKVGA
jgi:hypothetical protein